MRDICLKNGLRQMVREPTRDGYLLDLGIADIESASASVSSKLADHSIVTTRLNLSIPRSASHKRKVWSYTKAAWDGLREELQEIDWAFEACSDASRAAALMTRTILEITGKHIPQMVYLQQEKLTPMAHRRNRAPRCSQAGSSWNTCV